MDNSALQNQGINVEEFCRNQVMVEIDQPEIHPLIVMEAFEHNPNILCPSGFNHFEKTKGEHSHLSKGDEFLTHVFGPWSNKLKVINATTHDFKLEILDSKKPETLMFSLVFDHGKWRFLVESVEKKEKGFFRSLIAKLPFIRFGQEKMLHHICRSFAKVCCPKRLIQLNTQKQFFKF